MSIVLQIDNFNQYVLLHSLSAVETGIQPIYAHNELNDNKKHSHRRDRLQPTRNTVAGHWQFSFTKFYHIYIRLSRLTDDYQFTQFDPTIKAATHAHFHLDLSRNTQMCVRGLDIPYSWHGLQRIYKRWMKHAAIWTSNDIADMLPFGNLLSTLNRLRVAIVDRPHFVTSRIPLNANLQAHTIDRDVIHGWRCYGETEFNNDMCLREGSCLNATTASSFNI